MNSSGLTTATNFCYNPNPGYSVCYHAAQCECNAADQCDESSIVIEKCEKGFILNHKDKEYACETLASAYQVMQKLFKPAKDAE